jgi:hypothetical protein
VYRCRCIDVTGGFIWSVHTLVKIGVSIMVRTFSYETCVETQLENFTNILFGHNPSPLSTMEPIFVVSFRHQAMR